MRIDQNETVALVGESGCGKSTIVSLILRFYDVNEGQILVDGIDVRHWDLKLLRIKMGLVMQEPILFNYSVAENILYGKSDATNSDVRNAVEISNALEFIESKEIESSFDETCTTLFNQLVSNEADLINKLGKERFEEAKKIMKELKDEEEKKGEFVAVEGEIDRRS
jgi:ABC-type cobalamin/Fe3+-siderophores transport system ATPase subunit